MDASLNVWEITSSERFENGDNRVTWSPEFPAFTWATSGLEFKLKQLKGGEVWIDKVFGTVDMDVYYRCDADPCWHRWLHTSFCSKRDCRELDDPCVVAYPPEPFREGYVWPVVFPEPKFSCNSMGVRPSTIGYQFQTKIMLKRLVPDSGPDTLRAATPGAAVPWAGVPAHRGAAGDEEAACNPLAIDLYSTCMNQYQLPYQNYGAPSGQSNFGGSKGVKSGTDIFGGVNDQSNPFGATRPGAGLQCSDGGNGECDGGTDRDNGWHRISAPILDGLHTRVRQAIRWTTDFAIKLHRP